MNDSDQLKLAVEAEAWATFAVLFDLALIAVTLYLVFTFSWFAGGWGWFLLLCISPRSCKTRLWV